MNKSLLVGLVAGAGAATAVGAVANYSRIARAPDAVQLQAPADSTGVVQREPASGNATRDVASTPVPQVVAVASTAKPAVVAVEPVAARTAPRASYARVVDVQPVSTTVSEPREVCRDEPVTQQAPVRDEHRVAGTLAGAVIGGLLGHQIGDGNGRKIATVAGAAAGGYAGNRVQDRMQKGDTVTRTERRCETVYDKREQTVGYDVTYTYEGRTQTVRMRHAPGDRLQVRNGRVVTGTQAS
jgi:uncharacterized protein YcfJ